MRLGALAQGARLRLDVSMKVPHPARLAAFVAAVGNPRSAAFGHFLRRGQFGPRFGPTAAAVSSVRAWLRQEGLSPGRTSPDRLLIPVTAPVSAVQRAFGISMARYRLPGGRIAYASPTAPRVPSSVAPYVGGVLGLSDVYPDQNSLLNSGHRAGYRTDHHTAHARIHRASDGPQPCSSVPKADLPHAISAFARHYWITPLYQMGDFGSEVQVAVFEQEPNLASDITAYQRCFGIPAAVSYTQVDGGAGTGPGTGEAALDIENIIGLAPGAGITVFQGPNATDADTADIYDAMVNSGDPVLYTSWGTCEADTSPALVSAEQDVFEEAATYGLTVIAAAGDTGSTSCYQDDSTDSALGVRDPASQPDVIAVGGTTLTNAADAVWNDSASASGAGGGGVSGKWCMPAYQYQTPIPGLIGPDSKKSGSCASPGYLRQVPDVSAAASQESGYLDYYDGGWEVTGGTGGAGALWAGVAALVDASPFCQVQVWNSGHPGVLPPGLYYIAANFASYIYGAQPEGLTDVTAGDNAYLPSGYKGKLYPAAKGYDLASGLGTPLLSGVNRARSSAFYPGLAALMCLVYGQDVSSASVTGVSPRFGPRDGKQKITVTGTGFVPIAGADYIEVGKTYVAATCATATTCTLKTPKGPLGTANVRVNAEDLGPSAPVKADHYQYVRAPKITSLSPSSGPAHGGNTVTIRGAAFYGTVIVHFGKRPGTKVHVKSLEKLTVRAPAGKGTVKVTVTAAGGTSASKSYRY